MFEDRPRYSIKCGGFSFAPPSSIEGALSELRRITGRLKRTSIERLERVGDRNLLEIVVFSTDLMSIRLDPEDLSTILIPISRNHGKIHSITEIPKPE